LIAYSLSNISAKNK